MLTWGEDLWSRLVGIHSETCSTSNTFLHCLKSKEERIFGSGVERGYVSSQVQGPVIYCQKI